MESYSKYTPTELLKLGNDLSNEHKQLKEVIINLTVEVDELEIEINEKLEKLNIIEKLYVDVVDELNNR